VFSYSGSALWLMLKRLQQSHIPKAALDAMTIHPRL
jgi:hypothetical protein